MQKNLKIEYRPSYIAYFIAFILFFITSAALYFLNIPLLIKLVLFALVPVLIIWNMNLFYRYSCVLSFDGEHWHVHDQHQNMIVHLQDASFVSRYFMILVFSGQAQNRTFRFYFSRDNCSSADYRALCRLLLRR